MTRAWLASALALALAALGAAACGDDAPSDGPITIDIDNGSCGDRINFTGEFVDWDRETTSCGIDNALFASRDGGAMDTTAPNGRFENICVADQPVTLVDVTPAAGNPPCTGVTPSPYPMPGIAIANRDVIRSGAFHSLRTFTAARRDAFFAAVGFSFAPALAQVFVHVHGTPRAVSLSAAHAPEQAISSTAWAAGNTGHDVFFPNVDPAAGSTTLSVAGGAIGTGTIPLESGKFTYVTVYAR